MCSTEQSLMTLSGLTKVLQKSRRMKRPFSSESEIQQILQITVIFRFSSWWQEKNMEGRVALH